jgi:WD40 repeat protein
VSRPDCPPASDLSAFMLGTLSEESLAAVARHLETCPACEAAVAALDQLSDPVIVGLRHLPSSARLLVPPSPQGRAGAGRPLPERLGDYRIVRELGRGGMGVVYEAEQVSLGRRVALKVLPRHALLDPQSLERFQREARAVARLHHTNIVQVFGTGEQDGLHYFVMQLIRGVGLDQVIADLLRLSHGRPPGKRPPGSSRLRLAARTAIAPASSPAPGGGSDGQAPAAPPAEPGAISPSGHKPGAPAMGLPPKPEAPATGHFDKPGAPATGSADSGETIAAVTLDPFAHAYWANVARLGIQIAAALAFAHAKGIVHRDVKPSNLLLDLQGQAWITDFGLAKETAGPADLTHSGFLVGTLRYVPPERFQGRSDARGDVYGLGLTLYELLTLRPAFSEADRSRLVRQVMHDEPPRPRKLNPAVPRDLETVVLKAIARNPDHRYQAAADLAADLRRFVEDRPIRARRVTQAERLWRWCRRNPTTAALLGALLVVFMTGFFAVAAQWQRAENKAEAEKEAREQAQQAEAQKSDLLYRGLIAQARLEWRLGGADGANELLEKCEESRRGWEWHYLRGLGAVEIFNRKSDTGLMIASLDFSPDGRLLVFGSFDPYNRPGRPSSSPVEVWDQAAGRLLHTLAGPRDVWRVSFGADGRLLAVGGGDGTAQLWDTATGRKVREWAAGGLVTFSPDGRFLASGGAPAVTFWDPATGRPLRSVSSSPGRVAFSPDGRRLAISGDQAVEVREADSGREVCRLPHGPGQHVFYQKEGPDLAFSPDGKLVVVATQPPRVWDATTGQLLNTLGGHEGHVPGVAFSPDGCHVATASHDGVVRLWDCRTGTERLGLRGHSGWVGCVRFHPGGWCLASGGRRPADVKVWDLTRHPEYRSLRHTSPQALTFDPEGGRVRLVSYEGLLGLGDPATGQTVWGRRIDMSLKYVTPANFVAFSGDGRRVASASMDRRVVKVHDARTGEACAALVGLEFPAISVAVNRDGSRVAAAGLGGKGDELSREVRVWDAARPEALAVFRPAGCSDRFLRGAVALSPDGERLAFDDYSGDEARVRVWEVAGGRELLELPLGTSPAAVGFLIFSGDGRLLAASDTAGRVVIWDAATGSPLHAQPLQGPWFRLAFSPDGRRLAGVDREQVRLWDVQAGKELLTLRGAPARPYDGGFNPALAWSLDGRRLAAGNWDGSTSVWEGTEGDPAPDTAWQQVAKRVYLWHLREADEAARHRSPAVAFHLAQMGNTEPPDREALLRRARLFTDVGAWDRAAADYVRAFAAGEPEAGWDWVRFARLHLLRGDREGYRRLCARMLAHFGAAGRPPIEDTLIRAAVLGPGGVSAPAEALQWARAAWKERDWLPDLPFTLALAHGRAGQWQETLARVPESVVKNPGDGWQWWPVLALAHHHLGHAEEARHWLQKAAEMNEQLTRRAAPPPTAEEMDFRILYAEAASLSAKP